jgi:hypothetical protein
VTCLTSNRLRELLNYDPESGVFRWLVPRGRGVKAGDITGTHKSTAGHIQINVDGRRYQAHRLAWLYMTGSWPAYQIDHADCDKINNKWSNLREASRSENGANRGVLANNKCGLKGASWDNKSGKWRATITVSGRWTMLGYFDTAAEAHAAYVAKATELFGEFARAA